MSSKDFGHSNGFRLLSVRINGWTYLAVPVAGFIDKNQLALYRSLWPLPAPTILELRYYGYHLRVLRILSQKVDKKETWATGDSSNIRMTIYYPWFRTSRCTGHLVQQDVDNALRNPCNLVNYAVFLFKRWSTRFYATIKVDLVILFLFAFYATQAIAKNIKTVLCY